MPSQLDGVQVAVFDDAALRSVGVIMAVAMLITPAAIAGKKNFFYFAERVQIHRKRLG